jgi:hypothetical protein
MLDAIKPLADQDASTEKHQSIDEGKDTDGAIQLA